jgi:hypothetical protein
MRLRSRRVSYTPLLACGVVVLVFGSILEGNGFCMMSVGKGWWKLLAFLKAMSVDRQISIFCLKTSGFCAGLPVWLGSFDLVFKFCRAGLGLVCFGEGCRSKDPSPASSRGSYVDFVASKAGLANSLVTVPCRMRMQANTIQRAHHAN